MNRAWLKPSMGVSGLNTADHLISLVLMQLGGFKTRRALSDLSGKPEVSLKLRPANSELEDDHKQLRCVL